MDYDVSLSIRFGPSTTENSKGKMSSSGSGNPPHSIQTTPRGVATTFPLGGNHRLVRCGRKTRKSEKSHMDNDMSYNDMS